MKFVIIKVIITFRLILIEGKIWSHYCKINGQETRFIFYFAWGAILDQCTDEIWNRYRSIRMAQTLWMYLWKVKPIEPVRFEARCRQVFPSISCALRSTLRWINIFRTKWKSFGKIFYYSKSRRWKYYRRCCYSQGNETKQFFHSYLFVSISRQVDCPFASFPFLELVTVAILKRIKEWAMNYESYFTTQAL